MDKAIKLLKEQVGKPQVWGATGPDSFDCSGLVRYVYKNALGKDIPRVSEDQSKVGQAVSRENLQPGDLVFFDTMDKGKVSHVGMIIGLIFTGSMFWHIVIISALIIIGYNMFCH